MSVNGPFAPVSDTGWPQEIADMRAGFAGKLNVYRAMAHHPALLAAWADLREHIVRRTSLGPVRAEVVILRTGFRLGSDYEWAQHVVRARNCGLDDARILTLRQKPASMAPDDALLAGAVDELLDSARLRPATVKALDAAIGKEGILDLIATVGFYSTLAFILKSFKTPLDADIAAELRASPIPGSDQTV